MANRSFLLVHYKLFNHLDLLKKGQAKAQCLAVYLSLMKYAWKSKGYVCAVRYSTIEKDTLLSKMTVRRSIIHLAKLNIITVKRLASANEYKINTTFLVEEKATREHTKVYERTHRSIGENIINKNSIHYNNIDKIISKGLSRDTIIEELSNCSLGELENSLSNHPYYIEQAIALKKENDKPKVELNTGVMLKKLAKEKNPQYHIKKQFNIRNNIKPWENKKSWENK